MGNSAGKESRSSQLPPEHQGQRSNSPNRSYPTSPSYPPGPDGVPQLYASRHARGSRSELSTLFGLRQETERDRDIGSLEARREAKAEREARRLEREKVAREKERERSMRQEHVDGGYLVTQGVYTGVEDYSKPIVRQLMVRGPSFAHQLILANQLDRTAFSSFLAWPERPLPILDRASTRSDGQRVASSGGR